MKKLYCIFGTAVVIVCATVIYMKPSHAPTADSSAADLLMANVEALTDSESGDDKINCNTEECTSIVEMRCSGKLKIAAIVTVYTCSFGNKGSCSEGSSVISFNCTGDITGQTESIKDIYCF